MLAAAVSSFVVLFAVGIFFRLARRFLPATPAADELSKKPKQQPAVDQSMTAILLAMFLVLSIATGVLWFFAFCALGDYVTRPASVVVFQIDPRHFFWSFPAFFLGVASGGLLSEAAMRRVVGERYRAYAASAERNSGIDNRRLLQLMTVLVTGLTIVFVGCQLCDVTRFTEEGVSLGRFGNFGHRFYPYSSIQKLSFLPLTLDQQGHVKDRPEFRMTFNDRVTWSTESFFRDMSPSYDRRAFEYASERSGVALDRIER